MLISDTHRLLFVHVQKTGGITMDRFLREQLPDARAVSSRHATLGQILKENPELKTYWTFGFVRNPWARMVSWWSMIDQWKAFNEKQGRSLDEAGNEFWRGVAEYGDFEEFVMRGPDAFPRLRKPQLEYLNTSSRRADFIGRTESLAADAAAIVARFGLGSMELGQHNRSKHGSYQDYYTDATRARIAEVFAKDIDAFGYDF